ncbi:MAG: hypothetical protein IKW01_02075 [Firmicutes bacterium]|nr:hypothetical protein [Bacillota bacterium]
MSSKCLALLKAVFFLILGCFVAYLYFATASKSWHLIGMGLSAFLTIAYFRQAFDR